MSPEVQELQQFLLTHVPALEPWLERAIADEEEQPTSEYWLFNYVVRPFLEHLLTTEATVELTAAWKVLEQIAESVSPSVRNELFVVMVENLELWRHERFIGPAIRAHWFDSLTWFPKDKQFNAHVDIVRYRARWAEEIERIGGFAKLIPERAGQIADALCREFSIQSFNRQTTHLVQSSAALHRPRLGAARVILVSTSLLACALVVAAYIATTFLGTAILFRMGHHQLLNAVAHGNLYLEMKGKEVWEEGDRHSAYERMLQSRRKMFMWSQDDINLRSCSASARIPLPVFMALFLILPVHTAFHFRKLRQRRLLGQCLFCGYDLRGAAQGRCSECGEEFSRIEKTK